MRKRFAVRGIVQGVYFRNTAVDEASRLGVTGRIWNASDGSVVCVAEGDATAVGAFATWLSHGPPSARVETVTATDLGGDARFADFRISREPAE